MVAGGIHKFMPLKSQPADTILTTVCKRLLRKVDKPTLSRLAGNLNKMGCKLPCSSFCSGTEIQWSPKPCATFHHDRMMT